MRNSRKKTSSPSSNSKSIPILLLLVLAFAGVLYATNGLQFQETVDGWIGKEETQAGPETSASPDASPGDRKEEGKDNPLAETQGAGKEPPIDDGALVVLSRAASPGSGTPASLPKGSQPIVIPAKGTFSYHDWMKKQESGWEKQARTRLTSLLFEASVKAGLETGRPPTHRQLPAEVNPGFDVNIDEKTDFTLFNPHPFEVRFSYIVKSGAAAVELSGQAPKSWKAPKITVPKAELFPPETVQLIDYSSKELPTEGKAGSLIKVYADGKLLYKDFYAPSPRIVYRAPNAEELKSLTGAGAGD